MAETRGTANSEHDKHADRMNDPNGGKVEQDKKAQRGDFSDAYQALLVNGTSADPRLVEHIRKKGEKWRVPGGQPGDVFLRTDDGTNRRMVVDGDIIRLHAPDDADNPERPFPGQMPVAVLGDKTGQPNEDTTPGHGHNAFPIEGDYGIGKRKSDTPYKNAEEQDPDPHFEPLHATPDPATHRKSDTPYKKQEEQDGDPGAEPMHAVKPRTDAQHVAPEQPDDEKLTKEADPAQEHAGQRYEKVLHKKPKH